MLKILVPFRCWHRQLPAELGASRGFCPDVSSKFSGQASRSVTRRAAALRSNSDPFQFNTHTGQQVRDFEGDCAIKDLSF
jgi:hypothetical protein